MTTDARLIVFRSRLRDGIADGRTAVDRDPAPVHAIAVAWLDAFDKRDLDRLLALYADDATHSSPKIRAMHPDTGGRLHGKPALRAWWAEAFARLPSLRYETIAITADHERAVVEYIRHVPEEPEMPITEVFEVKAGKIAASRVFHG